MKKRLASALILSITSAPIALAQNTVLIEASFNSLLNTLATPVAEAGINTAKWEAIEAIKGVNWRWSHHEMSQHNFTMQGNVGDFAEIEIKSTLQFVTSASLSFSTHSSDLHAIDISNTFHPDELKKISTSCDEDEITFQIALYQWTKPGHTPLYLFYEKEFGQKAGSISYDVGYFLDDVLYVGGCKVVQ